MNKIKNALQTIRVKTGIECALFSAFGELFFSASGGNIPFALPSQDKFVDNIAQEKGVTYLRVHSQPGNYYVAVLGEGKAEKNYALFIEALIGSEEERFRDDVNVEEKLRMLLSGELNSVQRNMLRAYFSDIKFNHFMLSLVTRTHDMQEGLKHFLSAVVGKRDYIVAMDERTIVYFRAVD